MKELSSFASWIPLIKLFLFVGFFVGLLTVALIIVGPKKLHNLQDNAKRLNDVTLIANAYAEYIRYHRGQLPALITITDQEIASPGVDLCKLLVPDYLTYLPKDPSFDSQDITEPCPSSYSTRYHVFTRQNTITVSAPDTDVPPAHTLISVTRNIHENY